MSMSHLFSPYGNFTRATQDGQRFTIISGCCNGLLRLLVVVRWLDGGGLIPPMSVLGWFRTQLQQRYIDSYVYIYIYDVLVQHHIVLHLPIQHHVLMLYVFIV